MACVWLWRLVFVKSPKPSMSFLGFSGFVTSTSDTPPMPFCSRPAQISFW